MTDATDRRSDDTVADDDCYMGVKDTCKFLGVSQPTLFGWRKRGVGPPYYETPDMKHASGVPTVMYRRSELIAYMERGRVVPGEKRAEQSA